MKFKLCDDCIDCFSLIVGRFDRSDEDSFGSIDDIGRAFCNVRNLVSITYERLIE